MNLQTGSGAKSSSPDQEQLVPPVGRRQRRILLRNWQAALQAVTLFIGFTGLTLSSIVFMVLLYTPASSPLTQARDMNDLREVVDMQRQMIGRLQREDNYQDARQKALQSALAASGLLTDDVRARLEGIERALMAKKQKETVAGIAEIVEQSARSDKSALIGRPDGHERRSDSLIGRPDGHERHSDSLIGRPDGHERRSDSLIGRPDGHERRSDSLIGRPDGHDGGRDFFTGDSDDSDWVVPDEKKISESDESYEDILA